MNLLILTEGGGKSGYGHISRCVSLFERAVELGVETKLVIHPIGNVSNFIYNTNFILHNWLEKFDSIFENTYFDIILVDSYFANYILLNKIRKKCKVIAYMDDTNRLKYPPGVVINGGIGADFISYKPCNHHELLLGREFQPIRTEFINVSPIKVKKNIESIFVAFGGTDINNMTQPTVRYLNNILPTATINIILSNKDNHILGKHVVKHTYLDAERLINLLLTCDLAVIAGGQMVYEIARIGLPAIVVQVADNQKFNVLGWQRTGFINNAIPLDKYSLETLQIEADKLISQSERVKKSKVGMMTIDGNGTRRIVEFLLKKLSNK
jgi:spore coat polysaccharide biosynthesis predicted glycosyltransferase SpsG